MKTQTALYTWTAPDGTPRYLIDPAEWQDGQAWSRATPCYPYLSADPDPLYGPVWVRELLPIPDPIPEVAWLDGHPVAMRCALPNGSRFQMHAGGTVFTKDSDHQEWWPSIVVSWPDGSKPVPPTVDGAR